MICKPRAVKIEPGVGGSETGWAGRRHLLGEWGEQKKLLEQAVPCMPETARGELEALHGAGELWEAVLVWLQECCTYTSFVPWVNRPVRHWGWAAWAGEALPCSSWAGVSFGRLSEGFLCCPLLWGVEGSQGFTMNLWSGWVCSGSQRAHGVNGIITPYGEYSAGTGVNACSPYLAFDLTDFVVTLYLWLCALSKWGEGPADITLLHNWKEMEKRLETYGKGESRKQVDTSGWGFQGWGGGLSDGVTNCFLST